ncbi:hypothetical protein HanHA89_Chr12g0475571 [Helianthus annuus]|nr:hypothetical protein HanHA89_Chr12g0475571 [Helianthus annuus]
MIQKFILEHRTPQSLFLSYAKDIYGMFNLWTCSGMSVTVQIGILSQFVKFSPCRRINLFLPYQSLRNLFLSYVKVI